MTAHDFTDALPEFGIQAQKLFDMIGCKAVVAVEAAAEGEETLPYLLRLGQKFFCHEKVGGGIVIAAAVIGQIIGGRFRHGFIPLLGNAHAKNHGLGNASHIHGITKRRKAIGLLQKIRKM